MKTCAKSCGGEGRKVSPLEGGPNALLCVSLDDEESGSGKDGARLGDGTCGRRWAWGHYIVPINGTLNDKFPGGLRHPTSGARTKTRRRWAPSLGEFTCSGIPVSFRSQCLVRIDRCGAASRHNGCNHGAQRQSERGGTQHHGVEPLHLIKLMLQQPAADNGDRDSDA